MKHLTARQNDVMAFIHERITQQGYAPSFREIAEHLHITIKGAYDHVLALERKGYLRRHRNTARSLTITKDID